MIRELLGIAAPEHLAKERMFFWDSYDQINFVILHKLVHRVNKIIQADEIELRVVGL